MVDMRSGADKERERLALGARLNEALNYRKKTKAWLAEKIGVTDQAVGDWIRSGRIHRDRVPQIVEILNIRWQWFVSGQGAIEPHVQEPISLYGEGVSAMPRFITVPRMNVEGAMGEGRLNDPETIIGQMDIDQFWVRRVLNVAPQNLKVISGIGDSMRPTIDDGDLVLVDCTVERIIGDAVYVLNRDHAVLIKRVHASLRGSLIIKSDNPAYEPEELGQTEAEALIIAGRVVWVWKGQRP